MTDFKAGDRIRVTAEDSKHVGRLGNVQYVSQRPAAHGAMDVSLDGDAPHVVMMLPNQVQKVAPNAGKPKPVQATMTTENKTYMMGAYVNVLLRDNLDPQEFAAKVYLAYTEIGLLP